LTWRTGTTVAIRGRVSRDLLGRRLLDVGIFKTKGTKILTKFSKLPFREFNFRVYSGFGNIYLFLFAGNKKDYGKY
jgi:hypothetical protein